MLIYFNEDTAIISLKRVISMCCSGGGNEGKLMLEYIGEDEKKYTYSSSGNYSKIIASAQEITRQIKAADASYVDREFEKTVLKD